MKRFLIAFLTFGLSALAKAAPPQPEQFSLKWQECVALAAQNNPDLLSALNAMEAGRADYKGSYNGILPQVTLSNSYTDTNTSRLGNSTSWTLTGNARLNLIDFGEWATIQISLADYKQTQANVRIAANNVLLNLYKAFTGLLYAQESLQVDALILEAWKNNAQMVSLRYESGRESKGNNLNTQAQLLQAQSSLDQSNRELRVAQQVLNQVIGRDNFAVVIVTGTWERPTAPMPRPEFNSLLAHQPRILAQESLVERARGAIKLAHSTLWPTLSLGYSRGTQGPYEFPKDPFWTFVGTVNYPLFGAGPTATYYASVAAEREYNKARQDLRAIRNQALSDLESSWAAYVGAENDVKVQRAFLAAAKQRKDESDVRYRSGLMDFENWIIVVQDYVNFQQSFLRAQENLILAEAQWRFTTGEQL